MIRVEPLIKNIDLNHRAQIRAEYLCKNNQWSHLNWESSFGSKYEYIGEN